MQSFPLLRVNDDRSKLAFANGQYILISGTAYHAAGGHEAVRDRFVEDIGMAGQGQGARPADPGRLVHGIGHCRMYASLGQLVRGWSRILYDALGRKPWRLRRQAARSHDLLPERPRRAWWWRWSCWLTGRAASFPFWLLGLSLLHHVLMYPVLRLIYRLSVPGSRYVPGSRWATW